MASSSSSSVQQSDFPCEKAQGNLARSFGTLGNAKVWVDRAKSFSKRLMDLGQNTEGKEAAMNRLNTEDAHETFTFANFYLLSAKKRGRLSTSISTR